MTVRICVFIDNLQVSAIPAFEQSHVLTCCLLYCLQRETVVVLPSLLKHLIASLDIWLILTSDVELCLKYCIRNTTGFCVRWVRQLGGKLLQENRLFSDSVIDQCHKKLIKYGICKQGK